MVFAGRHNRAALTPALDPSLRDYYGRPARVLMADRFADALLHTISNGVLRDLPPIGNVDQVLDNTDVLSAPGQYRRLNNLYSPVATPSSH